MLQSHTYSLESRDHDVTALLSSDSGTKSERSWKWMKLQLHPQQKTLRQGYGDIYKYLQAA